MTTNNLFIVVCVVFTIVGVAIVAWSLKWGLRRSQVASIGWWKAIGLHVLFNVASIVPAAVVFVALASLSVQFNELTGAALAYVSWVAVAILVVSFLYGVRWTRALAGLAPYLLVCVIAGPLLALLVRQYVYVAYSIPTNSMAPTLLGVHLEGVCPDCGAPAFGPPPDPRSGAFGMVPHIPPMICSKELKTVTVANPPPRQYQGDRLLVCRLLKPQRWDLIAFRPPHDPASTYVKRVVGLPGENVSIHDGAVWIDGKKMEPPESIRGIRYSPTIETPGGTPLHGVGSVPVPLGSDEYFVLGDFVDLAYDARFWEVGAPGRPPYAVPASNLEGVVINVYWPVNRWRAFR